jgi:hypothetical protein
MYAATHRRTLEEYGCAVGFPGAKRTHVGWALAADAAPQRRSHSEATGEEPGKLLSDVMEDVLISTSKLARYDRHRRFHPGLGGVSITFGD